MDLMTFFPYTQALMVVALIALLVGMYQPKWVFFWLPDPTRRDVAIWSVLLFLVSLTFADMVIQKSRKEQVTSLETPAPAPAKAPDTTSPAMPQK